MSGLEIAGLVSGIIPLLQLAFDATKALKNHLEEFHLTTRKIVAIENTLTKISHHLQQLHRQFGNQQLRIPPQNASFIETEFNDLATTLRQVAERFTKFSQNDQSSPSRRTLRNLFSSKRTSVCNDTITELDKVSERLRDINQLLVTITSTQSISETQDDIIDRLQSLSMVDNRTSEGQDAYTPSFYVPTNPPIAKECLDYAAVDSEGNALTSEGKLKARLLQLINERQETYDKFPIVGALGMPGTGKTCALRGLRAEKDLRELFRDGILFLFCGPSASDDDVKQVLCTLVHQTGGHALSRDMKKMAGAKAIDKIIEKVSAWFKHKRCLFLVDDIWNKTATGSSFLSKLSTVVENCDTTSGLVYTTKDETIDIFDAVVRFDCLTPDSPACYTVLARAAGFSQEEIDQADQQYAFDMILTHCKGLKMALVVAGREVRIRAARYGEHRAQAWDSYANALKEFPHQLLNQDYSEYGSLYFQFSVALQTLGSLEKPKFSFRMPYRIEEMFQALCVAQKGDILHDSMLYRLWGLESIQQAREVSKLFADVSLVNTTSEFIDERFSEGILIHDLVHDYANYLADQQYIDRSWIKGWEVWGLRLLERYFGASENAVPSSPSFAEWWKRDDVSRHYSFQNHLQHVISGIGHSSKIRSGQSLWRHSSGVDRLFDMSESADFTWVEVYFTLRKSTIVEMHEFVTIMAREREVALSDLTCRMLIFATLLCLRLRRLVECNRVACKLAEERCRILCSGATIDEKRHGPLGYADITQPNETSEDIHFRSHIYVLPADLGDYLQTSVARSWAFYDNCFEGPGTDDDELYRILGVPLTSEKLNEAGIQTYALCFLSVNPSGCFESDLARTVDVPMEGTLNNSCFFENEHDGYRFIITPFFGRFANDDESSLFDHSYLLYVCLHVHEIEIMKGAYVFKERKKLAIAEMCFNTPPSMMGYLRTNREEPGRLEGQ